MSTHQLATDAAWIADAWPALNESRLKGTPRRWHETELTTQQRAQREAQHRAEKRAAGAPAGADSPAPLHLDVLDLMQDIARTTRHTTRLIQAGNLTTPPTNTNDQLRYIAAHAHTLDDDPHTHHAAQQMHNHRQHINRQWAQVVDGQRLKAGCPWCRQHALYFRSIGPEHSAEMVIRCESGVCNPQEDAGTWYGGKPCWPFHEWAWLATRIDHATPPTGHGRRA